MVFYNNATSYLGVKSISADRQPCIVCGHPTGDCTGDTPSPIHIAGFKTENEKPREKLFEVKEDIVEEVELVHGVMTKIIVHRKGKMISAEEAEKLGLL